MNNLEKLKSGLLYAMPVLLLGAFVAYSGPGVKQAPQSSAVLGLYLSRALERNPSLVAERHKVLADSEKIGSISVLPDPIFWAGVMFDPVMGTKIGKYAATQMVPWPGRTRADRNASRWEYNAAAQKYKDMENDVLYKVRVAYGRLFTLIRTAGLQKESVALLKRLETAALADYATSMQTQASVLKLQLEIAVIEDKIKQTLVEADKTRDELAALLDTTSGAFPDPDTLPTLAVPDKLDEAMKIAADINPGVRAAGFEAQAAQYRIASARAQFLPDLMLSIEYNTESGAAMTGSRGWMLMPGISLPLWPWSKMAEVRMAKQLAEHQRAALAAEKIGLAVETSKFYRDYRDAVRRIDLLDSVLVPKARQTLVAIEEAYRNGRATIMEYIDSERMLLDLRMQRLMQEERREMMAADIVICCLASN